MAYPPWSSRKTDINQGVVVKSELAFQAQDNARNLWNLGEFHAEFDDQGNFEQAPDASNTGLAIRGDVCCR